MIGTLTVTPGVDPVALAGTQEYAAVVGEVRLLRGHADGAADGVHAEQRTLRAAQHFHPVDVGEVEQAAAGAGDEYAVDVDTDARIGGVEEIVLPDAAHIEVRVAAALVRADGLHAHDLGCKRAQIAE